MLGEDITARAPPGGKRLRQTARLPRIRRSYLAPRDADRHDHRGRRCGHSVCDASPFACRRRQPAANAVYTSVGLFALSAFVLASGILFLHSRRFTRLLMLALLLQVPLVTSPLVAYDFFAGLRVLLFLVNGNLGASVNPGAGFSFACRLETAPFGLGINLVALVLLVLLVRNQTLQYE